MEGNCSISFFPSLIIEYVLIGLSLLSILYKFGLSHVRNIPNNILNHDNQTIADLIFIIDLSCWLMFFILIGFFSPDSNNERSRFLICWLDVCIFGTFIVSYIQDRFYNRRNDLGMNFIISIIIIVLLIIALLTYYISQYFALIPSLFVCFIFMFKYPVEFESVNKIRVFGTIALTLSLISILYLSVFITFDSNGIRVFDAKKDLCHERVI